LIGDFELHGLLGFLLHDHRPFCSRRQANPDLRR
jgi:hypothetical protein